jgi:hypothetical protein
MTPDEIKAVFEDEESGLRETVGRDVGRSAVALFSITNQDGKDKLELAGSGTLVRFSNSYFVLTAAHVWQRRLTRARQIGITVQEDIDHNCRIDRDLLATFGPPWTEAHQQWGPDLVFVRLPEGFARGLEARLSFHNLERQRWSVDIDHISTNILIGAPRELGEFTDSHARILISFLYMHVAPPTPTRGEFDYFELDVDLSMPGVPGTFGGVSGGGLWRVDIFESRESGGIEWSWQLEGVAFYEEPPNHGHRIIRCHGPESIRIAMRFLA